jgi:uncharacterized protein YgbK (DUF1537 family)
MPLICPTAQAQGLRHDDTTGKSTLAAFLSRRNLSSEFAARVEKNQRGKQNEEEATPHLRNKSTHRARPLASTR